MRDLRIPWLLALLFAALALPAIAAAAAPLATEHALTSIRSPLASASTRAAAKPKNRVSEFFFRSGTRARADRAASRARAWENCYELRRKASDPPLAAQGGATAAPELSTAAQRSIRSLEARLAEHESKLAAYREDPYAFDNRGDLARNAARPEVQQRIIEGRIRHIEGEIRNFQQQLERLRSGSVQP